MKYAVNIMSESGREEYAELKANTDSQAIREMRRYIADHPSADKMYLAWHRQSDGCSGYINPDGNASPTGKPWT